MRNHSAEPRPPRPAPTPARPKPFRRARLAGLGRAGRLGALAAVAACAGRQAAPSAAPPANGTAAMHDDIARIRAATERFTVLDSAVAAGYGRNGGRCLHHPPAGGMGFHHQNDALLDDRLEVERPEILVYERLPDGSYRLNGVEYIVPFSVRPPTAAPPTIMGRKLKPAPSLGIWYLHVWAWLEHPADPFADWHPQVRC